MYSVFKYFLAVLVVFGVQGCTNPKPETKIVYIKTKHPRQKTLKQIKKYKINDVFVYKDRVCIKRKSLRRASNTTKLLRKQNNFYRNQAIMYNKKFVGK